MPGIRKNESRMIEEGAEDECRLEKPQQAADDLVGEARLPNSGCGL